MILITMQHSKTPQISVSALARQAGVARLTARKWLAGKANLQGAKLAAIESAWAHLGGATTTQNPKETLK